MFSFESPHRLHKIYHDEYKKKFTLNYPKSAAKGFFPMDSRTSGKRAISVRATEGLYCLFAGIATFQRKFNQF